jgi:hypothetical protein
VYQRSEECARDGSKEDKDYENTILTLNYQRSEECARHDPGELKMVEALQILEFKRVIRIIRVIKVVIALQILACAYKMCLACAYKLCVAYAYRVKLALQILGVRGMCTPGSSAVTRAQSTY